MVYGPERVRRRGDWETGVLCDLSGDLTGLVAILMSARTRESVIRLLCGEENPPREIAASALTEFGNILVSQTASAVADTLGGRIVPGLPELVFSDAETALQVQMSPRRCPDASVHRSELSTAAAASRRSRWCPRRQARPAAALAERAPAAAIPSRAGEVPPKIRRTRGARIRARATGAEAARERSQARPGLPQARDAAPRCAGCRGDLAPARPGRSPRSSARSARRRRTLRGASSRGGGAVCERLGADHERRRARSVGPPVRRRGGAS
jgi:hypothetical protein